MPLRAERKSTLIHVAIVEDDDNYAETIQEYLKKFGKVQQEQFLVSRFHDGYEIVDGYNKAQDIILMDIEMGLMDGMEAAEQIRKVDEQVIIIFITNMAQYALRGYNVNALDYVLKPISYASFTETLKKAVRSLDRTKEKYLSISMRDGVRRIKTSDIEWIESMGHRLTFHTLNGIYETTIFSMKEMEDKLESEGFTRCSSSCLVNLKWVKEVENSTVNVNGELLKISRGKKNEFMTKLVSYMTE